MARIKIVAVWILLGVGLASKGQSRDSCIARLNIYTYKPVDSSHNLISKKAVGNFMKRINDCLSEKYAYELDDRPFEILAPAYLTKRGCVFGKYSFSFQLLDTSFMYATLRRIEIYYDFKGEEKKFFQDLVDRGQQKVMAGDRRKKHSVVQKFRRAFQRQAVPGQQYIHHVFHGE